MKGPLLTPTKRDLIASALRSMIVSGEIERGARVRQDWLAARFNTSITPVREALRLLEAEGLLTSEPHRGVRVASVSLEDLKGAYLLRRLVEPYLMSRAARRLGLRDLDRARGLLESMAASRHSSDAQQLLDDNREFHFLFYRLAGAPSLLREAETLWLAFPWDTLQVLPGRVQPSADEHERMLASLAAGDVDAAAKVTAEHLWESYAAVVAHLSGARPEDPFSLDVD